MKNMREEQNIPLDILEELVLSVSIKPRLRNVLITIMTDEEDITNPIMSPVQYVVAASESTGLHPMDKVYLDLKKLTKKIQPDDNRADTIEVIDIEPFFVEYEGVQYVCAFVDDYVIKAVI